MQRYIRQLANESLIYGAAGAFQSLLGILVIPVYTRLLSTTDVGVLSITTAAARLIGIMTVMGLDSAAGRWFYDTESEADRKITVATWAWWQLGVTLIVGLLLLFGAAPLTPLILGSPAQTPYLLLMTVALLFGVFDAVTLNVLRFQRRPWAVISYTIATSAIQVGCALVLIVWRGSGLLGVYLAQIAAAFSGTLLALLLIRSWLSPRHIQLDRLRPMLRYALPLVPAGLAFWIVQFADRYFVQYYTTVGDVGIYQIGSSLAALIGLVMSAFLQAWGPFYMSIHTQPAAKSTYALVFLIYLWVMCALAAGLSLFAPELLALFTTATYQSAAPIVGYLALGYMMIGLVQIAAVGTTIVKQMRPTGIAYTVAAVLNLLLNWLLVPRLGREGSAIATMIAFTAMAAYMFWAAQRVYPIPYRFSAGLSIIALTATLMSAGPFLTALDLWASLLSKALLLLLTFCPLLFALRIVDLRLLSGAFQRKWS